MVKANSSIGTGELHEAPNVSAGAAERERRVTEQLITDWEQETRRLGDACALMTLDLSTMTGPKWVHRFVMAISRPVVENSSLLFYGPGLAALLEQPNTPEHFFPMLAQLPARFVPVFTKGCIASTLSSVPVRMHGIIDRDDGRQELYRAVFIRLSLDGNHHRHYAVGALNCRASDRRERKPADDTVPCAL
jgi:hypothetical protein